MVDAILEEMSPRFDELYSRVGSSRRLKLLRLAHASTNVGRERVTLGADKGYDTRDFVAAVRLLGVTPHVAQNPTNRASATRGIPATA